MNKVINYSFFLIYRAYLILFKKGHISLTSYITRNSRVNKGCTVRGGKIINSVLEGKNAISKGTVITGSSLGFGTYIGEECRIKDTSIGK